ncbi:ComEC/Rec2 family competence protein [Rhizobium deserti]|uniref:ComEC/Rec2 family competence protein n=1 Tax=Rhizobium deserti TaxID=2547961 RepID=UPI00247A0BAF|nr:ComEC/Rec2 family competence protein [Rhizobium deserti]
MPYDPPLWPLVLAFVVLTAMAIATRHRSGAAHLTPLALVLFLAGMLLAELETWRHATTILDTSVTTQVTGVVERRQLDAEGRWRYVVRVEGTDNPQLARPPTRVSLLARARHEPADIGDRISGRVRISPPSGPALPGLNDFAFSSYFDEQGAVGFFFGTPRTSEPSEAADEPLQLGNWLFSLRSQIAARIRHIVPGDAGAFAAAIVTDERRAISQETTDALRLSGLAHIVAISGLNMALAAGIFFVGVRTLLSVFTGFAQIYPVKKIAASGALLMVTAYYLISGFGVSAERAYIMMTVILVAVLLDRQALSLRNVALAALLIIAMAPSEILGPSFQMSFAATVALVAGYSLWKRREREKDSERSIFRRPGLAPILAGWNFVAGVLVTSLIGSVSTAIFSVEHFHRLATYGLAANLAAMPLISFVVMPAGLVGMLLMPFGFDAPFLTLMGYGLEGVISIAKYVAAWGGNVDIGRQHAWFLPVASAGFLLLTLLRSRLRLVGIPFLLLAFVFAWLEASKPLPDMLISEDGAMVALLKEGAESTTQMITNRSRLPDFIYDQWSRALPLPQPVKPLLMAAPEKAGVQRDRLPDLTPEDVQAAKLAIAQVGTARFTCLPRAWCAARSAEGVVVAVVEDGRYTGAACDAAGLIIASRARFDRCRSGALLLNGATLRKTGAIEIVTSGMTKPGEWQIRTAMAGIDRPWTWHRHYDWRSRSFNRRLPEPVRQLINDSGE